MTGSVALLYNHHLSMFTRLLSLFKYFLEVFEFNLNLLLLLQSDSNFLFKLSEALLHGLFLIEL